MSVIRYVLYLMALVVSWTFFISSAELFENHVTLMKLNRMD